MLKGMQKKVLPPRRQQLSGQLQLKVLVEMLVEMLVELLVDLTCRACLAKEVVVLRMLTKNLLHRVRCGNSEQCSGFRVA